MPTLDFHIWGTTVPARRLQRQPHILRLLLAMFRRHRRARRTYLELSKLDERLLYDIGIDPQDVWDALQNRPSLSLLLHPMRRQFDFRPAHQTRQMPAQSNLTRQDQSHGDQE